MCRLRKVLPILSYNVDAINDNMVRDTTSPMLAANGVAKLSGFKFILWDISITATSTKSESLIRNLSSELTSKFWLLFLNFYLIPKIKHDNVAVNILEATNNIACSKTKLSCIAEPTIIANKETINDDTIAYTCTNAILPKTMLIISRQPVILPKLAWVDRRDARHISKLPLSPIKAGTRMNNSRIALKTVQCCN